MFKIIFLSLIVLFSEVCGAYRILVVFPLPYKSHFNLGRAFVRHLLRAGHEVTYITAERPHYDSPTLRSIDVSSSVNAFLPGKIFDLHRLIENEGSIRNMLPLLQAHFRVPNATLFHRDVQALLQNTSEEFDVVVTEWLFSELYFGLATVFNCPLIVVPTFEPISMFLSLLDLPNPAVTPNRLTTHDPPFTLWERVVELYKLVDYYISSWLMSSTDNAIFEKAIGAAVAKRGRILPPYSQVRANISLVLANSHVSTGAAMNLPQNFKQIGGFHIDEHVAPLPDNLQLIMDKAEHGVIYFSLGSVVRVKEISNHLKTELLRMFRGLKQTVIWKSDHPDLKSWHGNFTHSNCMLFITHGGLLSMTEAIHFGVPLIGVPLFSDQFINVDRAVKKGFARKVKADYNMAQNLRIVIDDMLTQSRYKEKMAEQSYIYHHRVTPPGDELVFWVEHVVKTHGAPHLQPPAKEVPLFQRLYLDFVLVIVVVGIAANVAVKTIRGYQIKVNLKRTVKLD